MMKNNFLRFIFFITCHSLGQVLW